MNKAEDYKELLEQILNTTLELNNMKDNPNFQRKKLFIAIVEGMMLLDNRSKKLYQDTGVNLLEWENQYFKIIENLLELCFGPNISEIISIYVYADPDTEEYQVNYTNPKGEDIKVETVEDLYDYVMDLVEWQIDQESKDLLK